MIPFLGIAAFVGFVWGLIGLVTGKAGPIKGRKNAALTSGICLVAVLILAAVDPNKSDTKPTSPTTSVSQKESPVVKQTTAPKQEPNKPTPPAAATSPSISAADFIATEVQFQDVMNGKQKTVVFVTNNHRTHAFSGAIAVTLRAADGTMVGSDTLSVDVPPGGKTWAIVWAKPGGTKFTASPTGAFKEVASAADSKGAYEIAGQQPGLNYITFYVIVPEVSKEKLVPVVEAFKRDYTKGRLNGFQIFFFPASKAAEAKKDPRDIDQADANYFINYNNGLSELSIYTTGDRIKI